MSIHIMIHIFVLQKDGDRNNNEKEAREKDGNSEAKGFDYRG